MMRKKSKHGKRKANAHEKHWHNWLHSRPCAISGANGVEMHHLWGETASFNKRHIGHIACIPLSYLYHRGMLGIHTLGKYEWQAAFEHEKVIFVREYEAYIDEGNKPFDDLDVKAVMDYHK